MKRLVKALLMMILAGAVLAVYLQLHQPALAPATDFYLKNSLADTGAANAVTGIYLNYRLYDTLFETFLLLVCAAAIIHLSWRGTRR
ncbi:MAG: hypothetical protein EOM08_05360 [Clostridia bacterium]|nr:hypothetical protein [Clostridia bacterium]